MTVEREKRKDQMLALQKSKQERTDTELSSLRQMYDLQQHKLAATRKELTEIREKDIKHRNNFSQLADERLGILRYPLVQLLRLQNALLPTVFVV